MIPTTIPVTYVPNPNAADGEPVASGGSLFTQLTDCPSSYAGSASFVVSVKADETGLEFTASGSGGGGSSYFTKVGTAYIGGDQTGDTRGAGALDVQSARDASSKVASGINSSAAGYGNTALALNAAAFGYNNSANGYNSATFGVRNSASNYGGCAFGYGCNAGGTHASAFGNSSQANGVNSSAFGYQNATGVGGQNNSAFGCYNTSDADNSSAFGYGNTASGVGSSAFGYKGNARIAKTTNIGGPIISRKDAGEADFFQAFGGVEVVLTGSITDLKTAQDGIISMPLGCSFYPNEVGVIITSADTVGAQPTVRFGNDTDPAFLLAATATTALTAVKDRQRFQTLLSSNGQTVITAGVTVGATATTLNGRFYFKGLLIED